MKEIKYQKSNVKKSTLDDLYNNSSKALEILDSNLLEIVSKEAPITMNLVKARLRESYNVAKISQKALDIIEARIKLLGFKITDNFYDKVLWPKTSVFNIDYMRVNYERQIYDVPYQEMNTLVKELKLRGEELYRAILKYFGFEVLTKKALDYLKFIEKMC